MPIVGVGTDIVEIARMQSSLENSDVLAKRILTTNEFEDFIKLSSLGGVTNEGKDNREVIIRQCRFLAKRFSAKEATVKAIGNGIGNGVSWHHIEVKHYDSGQPYLSVSGKLAELFDQKKITSSHLSISDEQAYAVAMVILEANN